MRDLIQYILKTRGKSSYVWGGQPFLQRISNFWYMKICMYVYMYVCMYLYTIYYLPITNNQSYHFSHQVYITGIDIDVTMTTSIDDRIGDMYVCRRSVLQAVGGAPTWQLPQPIDDCPILDFNAVYPRSGAGGVAGGQMRWDNCH